MSFKKIAIGNLYPNFAVIEDDYTAWEGSDYNNFTQIVVDNSLVDSEITRLQAEYDNTQYSRSRASEYPSIADQLDTLYHGGIDAWKAEVKVVKDKYPKG